MKLVWDELGPADAIDVDRGNITFLQGQLHHVAAGTGGPVPIVVTIDGVPTIIDLTTVTSPRIVAQPDTPTA